MNYKRIYSKTIIIILSIVILCVNGQPLRIVYGEKQESNYYFQWNGDKFFSNTEYVNKIVAYATEDSDVIELYGITKSQVEDFMDGNLLVLNLENVLLGMENQYYAENTNPYLTYCLVSGLSSNTVIHLIMGEGQTYYITEIEDGVRIYLTGEDVIPEGIAVPDWARLEIPLPDKVSRISDQDNYLEKNFQIFISGNQVSFYKENAILNPYPKIRNYTVSYDSINNRTILTFNTKVICGYQYQLKENILSVKVAKPNEIYSKIVVFDAGHGGIDPGAVKNGVYEKNINFKVLNTYVKSAFYNSDIKVYFTRDSDVFVDLYERAAFSEEVGADLFISLHSNSNNSSSVTGTQVFYSNSNNSVTKSGLTSYKLAKSLVDNISLAIDTKNRGASSAEFVVVKYNTVPAVLIELGFMTNSSELAKLTNATYQKKAANAIFDTVTEIFKTYPTGR